MITIEIIDKILDIAEEMHQELDDYGFYPPEWSGTHESFATEVLRRFNEEQK